MFFRLHELTCITLPVTTTVFRPLMSPSVFYSQPVRTLKNKKESFNFRNSLFALVREPLLGGYVRSPRGGDAFIGLQ